MFICWLFNQNVYYGIYIYVGVVRCVILFSACACCCQNMFIIAGIQV